MSVEDLIRQDMDRGVEEMRRIITTSLYTTPERGLFESFYLKPNPWWKWRVWWPLRRYVTNLWQAICGRHEERDEYDN